MSLMNDLSKEFLENLHRKIEENNKTASREVARQVYREIKDDLYFLKHKYKVEIKWDGYIRVDGDIYFEKDLKDG